MSFGIACWNGSGKQTLKISDRLTRIVGTIAVSANASTWTAVAVSGIKADGTWGVVPFEYWCAVKITDGLVHVRRSIVVGPPDFSQEFTLMIFRW